MTKFKKRITEEREFYPIGGRLTAEEMKLVEKLKNNMSHAKLYMKLVNEKLNGTRENETWFTWREVAYRREDFSLVGGVEAANMAWCVKTLFCGELFFVEMGLQSQITYDVALELREEFKLEVFGNGN